MRSLEVLVIDDEPAVRQVLAAYLTRAGHSVEQAESGSGGLERLAKGDIDVAVCDINMPGMSGIEVVRRAAALGVDTTFIMITAYASVDTAIEAMRSGAHDYIMKPLRHEELLHRLEQIGDMRGLRDENSTLRRIVLGDGEEGYRFQSPLIRELDRMVSKVAPTDSTVLITGESGSGKGVVARMIHKNSLRAKEAFIPVNCGAIPENLMESEFFGHTKGAFTGADKATKGLFFQADRGTIFLDEIGELPLPLQTKLLHVIEDKQIRALGSEQVRKVSVRIIAATNRNLSEMVSAGKFREDLYFRLSVFHIHVPPLRERREDIAGLVDFLLAKSVARYRPGKALTMEPAAKELLKAHDWPGNVRELENVIDRAVILAEGDTVGVSELPPDLRRVAPAVEATAELPSLGNVPLRDQVRMFEGAVIMRTIAEFDGDRRAAAQRLGIGLSSLYRKLEEYESAGARVGNQ